MKLLKFIKSAINNKKLLFTAATVILPLASPSLGYAEEGKEPAACDLVCTEMKTGVADCVWVPKDCNNRDNSKAHGKSQNIINPGLLNPGLIIPKDQIKPKKPGTLLPGDAFKPKSPGTILPGDAFKPKSSETVVPGDKPKQMTSIPNNEPKTLRTSNSGDKARSLGALSNQRKPKNLGTRVLSKSQSKRQSIDLPISNGQDK